MTYSEKNDVVIPFKVLEEIDKHKKRLDTVGLNARKFIKAIDEIRNKGSLVTGVSIGENKGKIFVKFANRATVIPGAITEDPDNQIISVALQEQQFGKKVILVTRDINMRVKCDALNLACEDYQPGKEVSSLSELFSGVREVLAKDSFIDDFYCDKAVVLPAELSTELCPNTFLVVKSETDEKKSFVCRYMGKEKVLKKVQTKWKGDELSGIRPKNKEQIFATDLLLDPSVELVSMVGQSGSGKTLLALAAGLRLLEEEKYKKLIVTRPVVPMGGKEKDIGFLPGLAEEKMSPWMQPIVDNLNFLLGDRETLNDYLEKGIIEIQIMTYIRGRSVPNSYWIIDEAQNLNFHETKTLLTRPGDNTKIVITGDLRQIDDIHLNSLTSGLTHAIERFKSYDLSGHVTLVKGERSRLASIAAEIFEEEN